MANPEVESRVVAVNEETAEYKLEGDHAWITVGNVSVYIKRADEGVSVDLYPTDGEDDESLAGTWITNRNYRINII